MRINIKIVRKSALVCLTGMLFLFQRIYTNLGVHGVGCGRLKSTHAGLSLHRLTPTNAVPNDGSFQAIDYYSIAHAGFHLIYIA